MYDSKALKWSKNKFAKIYETYKLNIDFPVDRRHLYSQSIKKMTEAAKNIYRDVITHNNNLSTKKIVNNFLSLN